MKSYKAIITQVSSEISAMGQRSTALSLISHENFKDLEMVLRGGLGEVYLSREPVTEMKTEFDVKKGDKVKYQFIRGRGGSGPEVSVWMKVKAVDGDMITASNTGEYGDYEFRVLLCQIVEHESKVARKTKMLAQERVDVVERHIDGVDMRTALIEQVRSLKGDTDLMPMENGAISQLRKRIEEFNLT